MLAIAGLYFYHQSAISHDAIVTAQRSQVVDQQLSGLQHGSLKSATMLSEVQQNLVAVSEKLDNEIRALNDRLVTINDQAESLDGRINSLSPFSRIGSDNIIHGSQWLSQQPADSYAIQVAAMAGKNEMYDLARRYNHYLKDPLSYYTVESGNSAQFVLVSAGYANEQEAAAALRRLPRYVNFQRPALSRMADIHEQL